MASKASATAKTRRERDIVAYEPPGIAASVPAFVVICDHVVCEVGQERDEGEQVLAERRVHLQRAELARIEVTLLQQDRVGNPDLADVVQEESVTELRFTRQFGIDRAGEQIG